MGVGIVSILTALIAGCMWLFAYGGQPLSVESLFWAAPLFCPIAFIVYRKSKVLGTLMQVVLYALSLIGAFHVILADCGKGNCATQNPIIIACAAALAGFQMIGMLATLLLMGFGAWKDHIRHQPTTQ